LKDDRAGVAITGASGYVGGRILRDQQARGRSVIALGRKPVADVETREFFLGNEITRDAFDGVHTLVHCAYDLGARHPRDIYTQNVVGSAKLLRSASAAGVRRLIHISSMSAYAGTSQLYGRSKLETERLVSDIGGVSLRLGLVWGERLGGMARAVQGLAQLRIVPIIGRNSLQFTVHEADATAAVLAAIECPEFTGVLGVASPVPVSMENLVTGLARLAGSETGWLVGIPWQPVYYSMRAAELVRLPLPFRADSVFGLVKPASNVPRFEEWAARDLHFRSFLEAVPS
jgi:nucleoside-diphosphate-sugar epimerase